jgi:hypothetical protein
MHWDVVTVRPLANFCIDVTLRDGSHGVFDMKPYLDVGIFQELRNPAYFNRVDVQFDAVTWPHGQDIAPETLYARLKATAAA